MPTRRMGGRGSGDRDTHRAETHPLGLQLPNKVLQSLGISTGLDTPEGNIRVARVERAVAASKTTVGDRLSKGRGHVGTATDALVPLANNGAENEGRHVVFVGGWGTLNGNGYVGIGLKIIAQTNLLAQSGGCECKGR